MSGEGERKEGEKGKKGEVEGGKVKSFGLVGFIEFTLSKLRLATALVA